MKWSLSTHCQMLSLGLQDKNWQETIPLVFHSHRSLCPHMARLVLSESPTSRLPQHCYGNAIGTENKNTASFLPSFQFTFDEDTNISHTIYLVFLIHFKLHLLIIKKFPQKILILSFIIFLPWKISRHILAMKKDLHIPASLNLYCNVVFHHFLKF